MHAKILYMQQYILYIAAKIAVRGQGLGQGKVQIKT